MIYHNFVVEKYLQYNSYDCVILNIETMYRYTDRQTQDEDLLNTNVFVLGWSDKLFQYKLVLQDWSTGTITSPISILPFILIVTFLSSVIKWSPHEVLMDTDMGYETSQWTSKS